MRKTKVQRMVKITTAMTPPMIAEFLLTPFLIAWPCPGLYGKSALAESRWSKCQGSVADDIGERVSGEAPQLDSTSSPWMWTWAEMLVCLKAALRGAIWLNWTLERHPVNPGVLYLWISWSIFPVSFPGVWVLSELHKSADKQSPIPHCDYGGVRFFSQARLL